MAKLLHTPEELPEGQTMLGQNLHRRHESTHAWILGDGIEDFLAKVGQILDLYSTILEEI